MKQFSLLLGAVVFLVMGSVHALAQGNSDDNRATHSEEEISFSFYNECCDEDVTVSGTVKYMENRSGAHVNTSGWDAVGTGSNGNTYAGIYVGNVHTNTNDRGQYARTLVQRFRFISDTGCDFTVDIRLHITTNAEGETVVEVQVLEEDCDDGTDLE